MRRSSTASSARFSSSTRIMSPRFMACKGGTRQQRHAARWPAQVRVPALLPALSPKAADARYGMHAWRFAGRAHLHQWAVSPLKRSTHACRRLCKAAHRGPQRLQLRLQLLLLLPLRFLRLAACSQRGGLALLPHKHGGRVQPLSRLGHSALQVGGAGRGRRRQRWQPCRRQQGAGVEGRKRLLQLHQGSLAVPAPGGADAGSGHSHRECRWGAAGKGAAAMLQTCTVHRWAPLTQRSGASVTPLPPVGAEPPQEVGHLGVLVAVDDVQPLAPARRALAASSAQGKAGRRRKHAGHCWREAPALP